MRGLANVSLLKKQAAKCSRWQLKAAKALVEKAAQSES
jgi:hypothetical protein